ncbi:hypothetical protein KTI78_14255, partial [Acinetobacter sp. WU_MDCI_Abxe161]|uniref:ESPR-type extended signal peptide-containing protein n=1 Tax=Acinetobacter sp. WU_MDCI_Abxe161 TaxID=2850074 RepID=UPI0021CD3538
MNKIYRMIWSERFGTWIAVSELSKSKTKSTTKKTIIGTLIILGGLVGASSAFAGYEAGGGSTFTNCTTGAAGGNTGSGAEGQNAIAIGATDSTTPVAGQACAPNRGAIAIGTGASTAGVTPTYDTTPTGANTANYNQGIAIGQNSTASGDQSIGLGANTIASGHSAIAIGGDDVLRAAAISGAEYTELTGDVLPTAFKSTTASGSAAIALGMQNDATGTFSTAIGTRSEALGLASIAMGTRAQATEKGAISIGAVSKATKEGAVALGNNTTSTGEDAVAIGSNTTADQDRAISIGQGATSSTVAGVALGAGSKVNSENSAAIGQNSVATAQTGDSFLTNVAASDTNGTVSVGDVGKERRIQNVSDGALDTDAVNVAQLKKLKDINDQQGATTAQGLGGGSTYDPTTGAVSAPAYTVNGTPVNNVGDAISELDKGWVLQSNGANAGAVKAGDTVDIGTADGETNLAVAKDGNSIKYSLNKDLTLNSVTAGNSVLNNDGLTIANGPSVTADGIDAGSKAIKNVAAGVDGTDAANVDQIKAASAAAKTKVQQGENIVVTKSTNVDGSDNYVVATAKDVKFDKTTVGNVVTDGATNKITGVEAGTVAA